MYYIFGLYCSTSLNTELALLFITYKYCWHY
uniref:Uncharacterized protein n=1 Tax=Anguilla anguilla TaxID=7936 RepID=A0A0E9VMU7_ANGAN